MKKKCIGLIPVRLDSTRLKQKSLLLIKKIPLIIHTYRRAKLSKKLDELIICCDDKKIFDIAKKFNAKAILTSKKHKNGTERIYEAYSKIKKRYDLIIDIQGDEPLINPNQIDKVIEFHLKNKNSDIILPALKLKNISSYNIVKIVCDKKGNIFYLSRSKIPHNFKKNEDFYLKHLSIISFTPNALKRFALQKQTRLEKIEGIELLRAIEIGLKIKTTILKGNSFSVDIKDDFLKAKKFMEKDKLFQLYAEGKYE
jgi:3-deoxy-manno-octulosonate cytidylyltransferase (CMP-KDO synthetase)